MPSIRRYIHYFDYLSGIAEYLFIHIPKNAGVAVRKSPLLAHRLVGTEPWFYADPKYTQELLATMRQDGEHHGIHHARLRDVHPKVRQRLTAVGVVRNPWARVVSRYRFALLAKEQGAVGSDYAPQSFEEFLEQRHEFENRKFYWHRAIRGWYSQLEYVTNEEGEIQVDLLRQEHLSEDATAYFGFNKPLARRNVSGNSIPYQGFYNRRTIQMIADWYLDDIEMFGFDFDSAATKNVFASKACLDFSH